MLSTATLPEPQAMDRQAQPDSLLVDNGVDILPACNLALGDIGECRGPLEGALIQRLANGYRFISAKQAADIRSAPMGPQLRALLRAIGDKKRVPFSVAVELWIRGYVCRSEGLAVLTVSGKRKLEGLIWEYRVVGWGKGLSRPFDRQCETVAARDRLIGEAKYTPNVIDVSVYTRCSNCGGKNASDVPCRKCGDTGEMEVVL